MKSAAARPTSPGATRSTAKVRSECYKKITENIFALSFITASAPPEARAGGLSRRLDRRRETGVALVTAILVVALASIAAAAILSAANIAIHRAGNLQDSEKAWWYADGVEAWVATILERDAKDNSTDSFKDAWAKPVDYLPVDEGYVKGRIDDLQGRFNLNNFGDADPQRYKVYVALFERLLQNIEGADPSQAQPLAAAIRDWIDSDSDPTGYDGAEDSEYLSHAPPYRTPNRPMESVSEVLAVKGMTRELYDRLTHCASTPAGPVSCITALPVYPTAINLNTAPEPLLRALSKQPTGALDLFLRDRNIKPLENAADAFNAPPAGFLTAADGITQKMVTVQSDFFLLRAEVFIGSGRLALYSFYWRPSQGATIVLGRSTDIE
ncbi:MAG: general secretion pathway protein GspK [Nevskiaceae bacterium]|nr:MAG: general secretion pathway protein GspK [Nevskiaceae bacterium]